MDASDVQIGDTVLDGAVKNVVTGKEFVTSHTYSHYDSTVFVPDTLTGIIINNIYTLCKYQSIYCNGSNLKHGLGILVGDIIYKNDGSPVVVTNITYIVLDGWYRFEISGNHNYTLNGLKVHNASRYWVGGAGTWDGSNTTNWAGTSGGGSGSSVPTSADDVTFDNLSNATGYICTVSGTRQCNNISMNAPASGTFTITPNVVQIFGNMFAASSGVAVSNNGSWTYSGTSGTKTIQTNNVNMQQVLTFNGGATYQLLSDYKGSSMTLTSGTFDPNGYTVNITTTASPSITGAFTFYNLTRDGNGSTKTASLFLSGNITVTNTFTVTGGSAVARFLVASLTIGTPVTITAASVNITNADFRDITGAGAASWNISAGLTGDCGGNSGITFTTPATQTATGTASFTWSTHGWTSRVPLPQDDVIINNAFVAGQTITQDMPRMGKNITFGCTGSPTLTHSVTHTMYGSLDLTGVGTITGGSTSTFEGRGTHTLNFASLTYGNSLTINAVGGTYTLASAMNISTGLLTLTNGTFNANTFNVDIGFFSSNNSNARTLSVGSGNWNVTTNNTTVWNTNVTTNLTYTTTPTINFTYSGSTGTRTLVMGSATASDTEARSINMNITAGSDVVSIRTLANNINFTGFSGTFNYGTGNINVYGNVTISSGMTLGANSGNVFVFVGTGSQNVTSAGKIFDFPITINGGGTVKLLDNLSVGVTRKDITLTAGTLDLNGFTLTHFGVVSTTGTSTRTFALGSGTYDNVITSALVVWNATGSGLTVTGTGTIKISGSTTNVRQFNGNGLTYPTLWFTNATANGGLDITGSNTFSVLKCQDTNTQTIRFTNGTTQTFLSVSGFQISGAASNLITINTISGSSTFAFSCPNGNVIANYLTLTNCVATGGSRWFAQNSSNAGGNNGWRFCLSNNRQSIFSL
ncbi:MAG: hypothetical protein WAQ28_03525 [Bacteroidia bacterium]